jgi:glycosyltransferase involved in cell wall biosynthesis
LESVAHYLKKQRFTYQVLLVDDGSTDESKQLMESFMKDHKEFVLLARHHQGKAGTVMAGMLEAVGDIILFTDLDQATPIHQLEQLLPYFGKGYDIVIGSRSGQRRGAPFLRRMMAVGFMALRNLILDLGISDTQCGFKAFRRSAARDIFPKLKVHSLGHRLKGSTVTAGFDVELLYIAKISGYKIMEVPVEWHYQETRHVSPLKDSLAGLFDLFRIRINSVKGRYGRN